MVNLTPTACLVNELRIREHLADAERYAPLRYDVPAAGWRTSLVLRLALALSRPVASLVPRRSPRPGLQVAARS